MSAAVEEFGEEAKETFKKFVHKVSHDGLHSLRQQYNELRTFTPSNFTHTASDSNPTKCRYKDIICLDASRVVLNWPAGMTDNFVHANWVCHELFENRFICTQAPLDSTVGDFWRICWQENVRQIIMLCRCEEMGKAKCAQYWPLEVSQVKTLPFGLTVTCQKIDKSDKNFIHTRLLLEFDQEVRKIDHRQWTTWPDKSVPQTPLAPFRLLQYTRKQNKYPSLIHCSAGVGRTGTMVAIEMIYKSLSNGKMPDSARLLQNLRSQRFLAVQTEDQYVYCHFAIVQFAYAKKMAMKHDVKMFCKEYNHYAKMVLDNGGRPPPLNATKFPAECMQCKRDALKIVSVEQKRNQLTHDGDVEVEPTTSNCSTSPFQTKMTPSGVSPIHQVQSMPNWSVEPKPVGAKSNLQESLTPTEVTAPDDRSLQNKTEPICPVSTNTHAPQKTFTVTHSIKGGKEGSTKIVYHNNPQHRFVKAIAGPCGVPVMQVSVPKYQLDEFNRQLKLKAEELERKKQAEELERKKQAEELERKKQAEELERKKQNGSQGPKGQDTQESQQQSLPKESDLKNP